MAHVRLFAGAADAIGITEAVIPADTSTQLRETLAASGTAKANAATVLAQCSLLVDGVAATGEVALTDDSRVDVLPPFAGG